MPKNTKFKVGEIVQLKSGGPPMTVKEAATFDSDELLCYWFAGSKLSEGWFNVETLELSTTAGQ